MDTLPTLKRVALVTGANSGIGRVTARELALRGYHVVLACRSESKTRPVIDEINRLSGGKASAEFLPLDLGDLGSVRQCAESFLKLGLPLHLLIANAGLAGARGMTASGFELSFGTCHVGHFLLTQRLLETLKASAPARVVVVASQAHRRIRSLDFESVKQPTRTLTGLKEYGVAKLSNILFAKELARQLQGTGVTTYSLHPGVVATNVWRSVPWPLQPLIKRFMITEEQGAQTTLYCATDERAAGETGLYYERSAIRQPSALAEDAQLAARLWSLSQGWAAVTA